MNRKIFRMLVLASVTAASSIVLASDGPTIMIPMPPPASRPSQADMSAVTDAQQEVANAQRGAQTARAELINAQASLKCVTRNLQTQLETAGKFAETTRAMADAKVAYEALAQPILASLVEHADYRNARDAVAKAQRACADLSARVGASTEERIAAAQAVLSAKAAVAKLENAALESNADVLGAKKKQAEAAQRLKELRAQLWQTIRQDPTYVAASQAVDAAREKAAVADQELTVAYQDLSAAQRRFADKHEARRQVDDWTYHHGLPDAP